MDSSYPSDVPPRLSPEQALRERCKELDCLYGLGELANHPDLTIEALLQGVAELIPPAFWFPEDTAAAVSLNDMIFTSSPFRETSIFLESPIVVNGQSSGAIRVFRISFHDTGGETAFLPDERRLLNALADRTGRIIERIRAAARNRYINALLRSVHRVNLLISKEKNRDRLLEGICRTLCCEDGFKTAWLALLDHRGRYVDAHQCGLDSAFSNLKHKLSEGYQPRCMALTLQSPEAMIMAISDEACEECPHAKLHRGFGALAVRIERYGRIFGHLSVAVPAMWIGDQEVAGLLQDVASDLAMALTTIETAKAHQQLQRSLELANEIVESSPVVLFRWRALPGWPAVYVSSNVRRFGYRSEDFLSGRLAYADVIHPDDLTRVTDEVTAHTKRHEDVFRQEYRIVDRDGNVYWVDDRTVIERDGNSNAVAY